MPDLTQGAEEDEQSKEFRRLCEEDARRRNDAAGRDGQRQDADEKSSDEEAEDATLPAGTRVKLKDLRGATELNGKCGTISGQAPGSGKWQITLGDGGRKVNVELQNFDIVAGPGEEEEEEDEMSEGCAADPVTRGPRKSLHEPTAAMRQAHEATGHAQYRPWCRWCVQARKPNRRHRRKDARGPRSDIPEVHADFCFFRDRPGTEPLVPAIVSRDVESGALAAHVVAVKGEATSGPLSRCVAT